jgi:hypothetical protein
MAVDTRTDSPYYGRVMVANGVASSSASSPVGIVKFNADGSEADEGQSAFNGNAPFRTDGFLGDSVRSVKYGSDDRVYYNDWVGSGKCIAFDMIMSTNQVILDTDTIPGGSPGNWADMDVTDPGTTNALVWFGDATYPPLGVMCWPMTNNGVAASVVGINVVAQGPDIPLRSGHGMMMDETGDIFIGEVRSNPGDTYPKVISITNVFAGLDGAPTNWWNSATAYPITSTDLNWQAGTGSDMNDWLNVEAVAIDSRTSPRYVSAAFSGGAGGMKILNAADGTIVTNLNQNVGVFSLGTSWDAAGNVYLGNANHSWQAFSPPGTNQATTLAVVQIAVVLPPTPPHITDISVSGGTVTIHFTAGASDPASAFTLLSSGTVSASKAAYTAAAGASITGSAGSFTATVPASENAQFYLIKRLDRLQKLLR